MVRKLMKPLKTFLWASCPHKLCAKLYIVNIKKEIKNLDNSREGSDNL